MNYESDINPTITQLKRLIEQCEQAANQSGCGDRFEHTLADMREALVCLHGARQKWRETHDHRDAPLAYTNPPKDAAQAISEADARHLSALFRELLEFRAHTRTFHAETLRHIDALEMSDGPAFDALIALDTATRDNLKRTQPLLLDLHAGIARAQVGDEEDRPA